MQRSTPELLRQKKKVVQGTWIRESALTVVSAGTIIVAALSPAKMQAQDNVTFSIRPSRSSYVTGDTVLLAVSVTIKPNYYLYGNPVGPGGGRPIDLTIRQKGAMVRWLSVKKMKAEKIGPPFGDWVWAYRNETVFFCSGVVVLHNKYGVITSDGSINIEALICRDACRLQRFNIPFSFEIVPRSFPVGHFRNNPDLLSKYAASIPMVDLMSSRGAIPK